MTTTHPQPALLTIRLAVISRRPIDRWPLRGDYVEVVWAQLLGPTAIAIARRLGRAAVEPSVELSIDAISTSLSVTPGKALQALRRLHRHGLIDFDEAAGVVRLSGWAPSIPPPRAVGLCPYARHAYGDSESDAPHPAVSQPRRHGRDALAPSR